MIVVYFFFFSSRRRHTRCALVTEFRRVLFRSRAGGRPDHRRDAARALPLPAPRPRPGAAGEPLHGTRRWLQGPPWARPGAGAGGGAERGDAGAARREPSTGATAGEAGGYRGAGAAGGARDPLPPDLLPPGREPLDAPPPRGPKCGERRAGRGGART